MTSRDEYIDKHEADLRQILEALDNVPDDAAPSNLKSARAKTQRMLDDVTAYRATQGAKTGFLGQLADHYAQQKPEDE
ncbi:hypothetical protein [Sinomonas albida]|uniref:hypothetical protein n=1 Tax=Sinomonas albida TaxID=369942 RepID=UPI0030198607